MAEAQNFPLKNYFRGLAKSQLDANQAGAVYSKRVFGLGDEPEYCNQGFELTWDEYGRGVGTAGVKTAAANGCDKGVYSAEYRMNVETATRPALHVEGDEPFDNLRLGRDIADRQLEAQISTMNPMPKRAPRPSSSDGYRQLARSRYN